MNKRLDAETFNPKKEQMKNFDIENLERKNIYTTPDNFFTEMQANVLKHAVPQKEAPVFRMNWAYAAAAAVATLFGVTFFMNQSDDAPKAIAQTQEVVIPENKVLDQNETQPDEAVIAYQTLSEDLTSVEEVNQKEEAAPIAVAAKAKKVKQEKTSVQAPNPDVQIDQVLANITTAELADLGINAEQDVYLDLY